MDLITTKEACLFLGVSEATLRRMARDGDIAKYKVRGSVRFDKADLRRYLASCRVQVLPPVRVERKARSSSRCEYVPGMQVV